MDSLLPIYIIIGLIAMLVWATANRKRIREEVRERGTFLPRPATCLTMMAVYLVWPAFLAVAVSRRGSHR